MSRPFGREPVGRDAPDVEYMPPKLDPDTETKRLNIVAPASWVKRLEEWRRAQPDLPNTSEAIRRLVDAGMEREARRPKR